MKKSELEEQIVLLVKRMIKAEKYIAKFISDEESKKDESCNYIHLSGYDIPLKSKQKYHYFKDSAIPHEVELIIQKYIIIDYPFNNEMHLFYNHVSCLTIKYMKASDFIKTYTLITKP